MVQCMALSELGIRADLLQAFSQHQNLNKPLTHYSQIY